MSHKAALLCLKRFLIVSSYTMIQLNILIVGGGIAGCSSAIALLRKGHTVTILERHPTCQALGGPVGLPSNATRVLIHYGMGEIMTKKDARESSAIYQRRYDTGAILGTQWGDATLDTYGFPYVLIMFYHIFDGRYAWIGRNCVHCADAIQTMDVGSVSTSRDVDAGCGRTRSENPV